MTAQENALNWWNTIVEMVAEIDAAIAAEDDDTLDAAQVRVWESVLSVQVRDGWRAPGIAPQGDNAEEYEILLTTGGPALRIYGHLDMHSEPDLDPMLQYQDWGTPWTDWWPVNGANLSYKETLRTFACQFYFGQ